MPNQDARLTASNIKYLISMWELGAAEHGIHSIDLAKKMNISKPSTHAMVLNLCAKGLASKDEHAVLRLTHEGAALAEQCARCYEPLICRMTQLLKLGADECADAACSILTQVQGRLPEFTSGLEA